jgi:hypothetical protein
MASLYGHSALSRHVGRAIPPSVLLITAGVVLGAVTRPFMAAQAGRAAITASRASSERRHSSSTHEDSPDQPYVATAYLTSESPPRSVRDALRLLLDMIRCLPAWSLNPACSRRPTDR